MSLRALLLSLLSVGFVSLSAATKPDVIVVADAKTSDEAVANAGPDHPVYYVFIGGQQRDVGSPIAGAKFPKAEVIRTEVKAALAKRGFLETYVGGPAPKLAIVYVWGTATLDSFDMPVAVDAETEGTSKTLTNEAEVTKLVGIDKANREPLSATEARQLDEAANVERLYLLISALDVPALLQKQKRLIWRTRLSIEAKGEDFGQSLGVMLASGAPFFGKDEAKPVVIDDALRRKTTVTTGELQVVGYEGEKPPAKK